jgi:hypothetical protein
MQQSRRSRVRDGDDEMEAKAADLFCLMDLLSIVRGSVTHGPSRTRAANIMMLSPEERVQKALQLFDQT